MALLSFVWDQHGVVSLRRVCPAFVRDFPAGFERDLRLRPPPGCSTAAAGVTSFFICRHVTTCAPAKALECEGGGPGPHPVPLVKSCLQKAMRRGLQRAALSATAYLLARDPKELLRRLPNVLVEDVGIATDLPKLMWLSVAVQHGYRLSEEDEYFVLALVAAASTHAARTVPPSSGSRDDERITNVVNRLLQPCSSMETEVTREDYDSRDQIAMCLVLRACYGGMAGDIDMLLSCAANPQIWGDTVTAVIGHEERQRLKVDSCHQDSAVHSWLSKLMSMREHWSGPLPTEDQLDVAVDFHCSDVASRWHSYLRLRHVPILPNSEQEVKDAMWTHRSSLNFRSPQSAALPAWWDAAAEGELGRLCRTIWIGRAESASSAASAKRVQQADASANAKKPRNAAGAGRQLSIFRFAAAKAGPAGA